MLEAREMLISMPSGPNASMTFLPTMWRVSAEAASVTNRKSERAASSTGSETKVQSLAKSFGPVSL
ncbi:hypothetical protein D9M69_716810 [compost metagenome]